MIYIAYLDQIKITGKFQSEDQIKAIKPRVVAAAGYKVKEDALGIYIASTINGPQYANLLFIPRPAITDVVETTIENSDSKGLIEVSYIEAQGMDKVSKDKLESLSKPPVVKLCGFKAGETDELLYIAQEKNADGNFRGITAIPKKYLVQE